MVRFLPKFRFFKTLRVNFALLPFKQAMKLPIVVTGKLKIGKLNGKVIFDCPIKFGLVNMGKDLDNMPIASNPSRLLVNGILRFKGKCVITQSSNLTVWADSEMTIGRYVVVCSGVLLKSACKVSVGDFTRLTSGCFVMDSNVHAIKDAVTGRIAPISKPIEIGKCCWLAMNTSVTAGAKIPDYSISTRYAVLNKDYTLSGEKGCLLAGMPAKIVKSNCQRIFDLDMEQTATNYFKNNPDAEYFQVEPGFEQPENIKVESNFTIY